MVGSALRLAVFRHLRAALCVLAVLAVVEVV